MESEVMASGVQKRNNSRGTSWKPFGAPHYN